MKVLLGLSTVAVEDLRRVFNAIDGTLPKAIEQLRELCARPSISAHGEGLDECAEVVRSLMEEVGLRSRLIEMKEGPPVVYGELKVEGGRRTLLVYDHYDVQPPDPLDEWDSQPFRLTERGGRLIARGVADDKGTLICRLAALRALLDAGERLPINLKFLVEGEEEVGSPHLKGFIEKNGPLLKADGCLWEQGYRDPSGRPEIHAGVKGILYIELRCKIGKKDLHSSYAPLVPSPAWRLLDALRSIRDEEGKVLVKGFYDGVLEPSEEELSVMRENQFDVEGLLQSWELDRADWEGEPLEVAKKLYYSPTCNICGLSSGYQGPGAKTILPRQAIVKLDFRLVPNQSPEAILERLREHLKERGFDDLELISYEAEEPARTPLDSSIVRAVAKTADLVYGERPNIWPNMTGTGPMSLFIKKLKIPSCTGVGVTSASSALHAPNENIRIEDFVKGIKHAAALYLSF